MRATAVEAPANGSHVMTTPNESPQCLERATEDCDGPVEYRESLSGTGTPIARCAHHWAVRLADHAEHVAMYPDSPVSPPWFDPSIAGESWDDES